MNENYNSITEMFKELDDEINNSGMFWKVDFNENRERDNNIQV